MRNRIFGAVGIVWGGAILYRHFTAGPAGEGAYAAGAGAAAVLGGLMLVAGLYYFLKG